MRQIIAPPRGRAPSAANLLAVPSGGNLIGVWTAEKSAQNWASGSWNASLQAGGRFSASELGQSIDGTNYWLNVGNGSDFQDWWIAFSFITIVGEGFTGHMWGRGTPNGTGDWSILTDLQRDSVTLAVVSNSVQTPSVSVSGRNVGSGGSPVAVGVIYPGSGSGTMCAVGRNGVYASATGPSDQLRIGISQWNFGAIADTGGETSAVRPVGPLYGTMFWNRAMPLAEMQWRVRSIQREIDRPKRRYWAGFAAGGAAPLAGAAAAVSTASGTLSVTIPLAGAAAAIVTANGTLALQVSLGGNATDVSTAIGALSAAIPLAAAASAQATAAGTLSVAGALAGAAQAQATAAGDLRTSIAISGAAAAVALAQAALSVATPLAGAAISQALATGDLRTAVALAGAAIDTATATGALNAGNTGLAGSASDVVTMAGALTQAIPLAGAASAIAVATGGLTTGIPLAGEALDVSTATGTLAAGWTLAGAAVDTVTAAGSLSVLIPLNGAALAQALAQATLLGGQAATAPAWRTLTPPASDRTLIVPASSRVLTAR